MSKINAVRIINLNYNNNSIRISDETFQMGGQSTLLSLRNGGGKSVLVQMMTAPFVHKQYRKTKDRPFESYFTTSKPTFILVEWLLDQDAGYCLTGMMVRKSQASEEQSSEPLEIVQFISEYAERCEHDIYNIPVVEKSKNEVVLKNFNACRQLFEMYKKDRTKKFFYYDMNNYAQSRQYFDKLSEYKIDYKEWESIIRKVNLKESGLSELFSDCKTEKDLVEKWFLDTIQSKLNHDQNRIKEFQSIVDKYIRMYKDNKSKIERRDTILKFKEDMISVQEKTGEYQTAEENVEKMENQIACFVQELNRLEESMKSEQQKIETECAECDTELEHVLYEKLSKDIYDLMDKLLAHEDIRDTIKDEQHDMETDIADTEKKVHLYECAKRQGSIDELQKDYEYYSQRIDVSRKNEKELEPQRRKIGGILKNYYIGQLESNKNSLEEKETCCQKAENQLQSQKKVESDCENRIRELLQLVAAAKTRIEEFTRREADYNMKYHENFARNILGNYEAGMLDIRRDEYGKQLDETEKSSKRHSDELVTAEEKKRTAERRKEDIRTKKSLNEIEMHSLKDEEKSLRKQIEQRQIIMRYLDMDDTELWNVDGLLENADRKLNDIDRARSGLVQEQTRLSKECRKLSTGEVLELPQEFRDLLQELELHPVYGMDWLSKNGYTEDENKNLVRRQPFIPYALILPEKEIDKLELHGKEIYTSFPIPLIQREELEKTMLDEEKNVVRLTGISFYLWFNEKLLNEDELRLLIQNMNMEIHKLKEQIDHKDTEYREYMERRSILNNQTLTKEKWDKNRAEQEEKAELDAVLEKNYLAACDEIKDLEKIIDELTKTIQEDRMKIDMYRKREIDFRQFCDEYVQYQNQRELVEMNQKESDRFEQEKVNARVLQQKFQEQMKTIENEKNALSYERKRLDEKYVKFAVYECDETDDSLSVDELEARYEAITTQMSQELQELENLLERTSQNLISEKRDLENIKKKYRLMEREWKSVIYDERELRHQEILLEDKQKKYNFLESKWHEEDKEVYTLNSRIQDKKHGMTEQTGREDPLPKEEIHTVDFDAKMNKIRYRKKELNKEIKQLIEHLSSITENLTAFSEYQDFQIKEEICWEQDPQMMDERQLREFAGIMRRDYRQARDDQKKKKDKLVSLLNFTIRKDMYQEDYYQKPLEAMLAVTDHAGLVLAQIQTTVQSYDSQMEKLAVDIGIVEKEKGKIEDLLEDYIVEVHNNMGKIDNNSTITIRERPVKMLRLQLPDWEENAGLYRQRLDDFMDEVTLNGIDIYEKNENAADYLSSKITTRNLYDTVVGVGNVQIKLYKIEEQREYPITWADVSKNSGGEGFLSAFVVLSSLMHYMRRDDSDIFADKNEGKVLIMDNPFAQTNAAHLLKPLMDIAKKTNTQLICLSGLGGDSIYSRFDNIYVLKLVMVSLQGGIQYLRGSHKKGPEEETMVSSHIEVYEQQSFLF